MARTGSAQVVGDVELAMQRKNAVRWMFAGVGLAAAIFLLTLGQETVRPNSYIPGTYTTRNTPLDFIPFAYEFFWDGWGYVLAAGMFLWGAYRFLTAPKNPG
jgi:hypothetical protein